MSEASSSSTPEPTFQSIGQVPMEIWQAIFDRVLPPPFLVYPPNSLINDADSFASLLAEQHWAILSVCKAWYQAGLAHLYKDVYITRPERAFPLLRTLKADPNLGPLVQRLRFRCLVETQWHPILSTVAEQIISLCPCLFGIELSTMSSDMPKAPLLKLPLQQSSVPITHLEFTYFHPQMSPFYQSTLHHTVLSRVASTLVNLSVVVTHIQPRRKTELFQPLDLPCLESFTLSVPVENTAEILPAFRWKMPSLRRLTLQGCYSFADHIVYGLLLQALLQRFGQHLKYLHIKPPAALASHGTAGRALTADPELDTLCPVLEHLVLHPRLKPPENHPTLRWIDMWRYPTDLSPDLEPERLTLETLKASGLPSLLAIRWLSVELSYITDLPLHIPPRLDAAGRLDDGFDFDFYDFILRYRDAEIYFAGPVWDDDDDEDEDSDYESPWETQSECDDWGSEDSDIDAEVDELFDGNAESVFDELSLF